MNIPNLREQADSGNVVAQSLLGTCYLDGIDVEIDYMEALRYLTAAANQGAARARFNLARMYEQGLGKAIGLYELAAEAEEFLARVELGRIYSSGKEIAASPEKALRWYSAAVALQDRMEDCEELKEAKAYLEQGAGK
jgi:uncharacterized protein